MTNDHGQLISELKKHPSALISAYEGAVDSVSKTLGPAPTMRWAQDGVRIAQQGPRAWEAATEYFRASSDVVKLIGFPQFERWVESGIELTVEAPVIAAAFFRASPNVLPVLAPGHISGWASLGRGLSRGTWKSSSLAARFFDISDELVQNVNFHEMQLFVALVQKLASRSYDLAAEALVLAEDEAPGADLAALLGAPPSAAAFLSAGVCPENFLVGENSPSLCPTISSEIVIGINVLPL